MSLTTGDHTALTERLAELAQELLDAHCDTVCLARQLDACPDWAAHVDYLQGLQRVGQRTLAELSPAV